MDFLDSVRRRAASLDRTLVLPEGGDPRVVEAAVRMWREGWVRPVLLGPVETVRGAVLGLGADPDGIRVLDPADSPDEEAYVEELRSTRKGSALSPDVLVERVRDPLVRGALMVRRGEVDGSVAGAAHSTGDVLRAALWCVGPAPGIRTVSSSFYMVVPAFRDEGPEVLTFTDAAVVPDPDPRQLAEIGVAAARARSAVVGDQPRVAFLSYSTRGSARGVSIEKVVEALGIFREHLPDVPVDGELQGDAALVEEVARTKAPGSQVAGRANVLVFPDLDAGNIAYKLVQRLAGAEAVGPIIQGLARPCNDLSRGADVDDVVSVACVTALMTAI